jgi:hypothetical protein
MQDSAIASHCAVLDQAFDQVIESLGALAALRAEPDHPTDEHVAKFLTARIVGAISASGVSLQDILRMLALCGIPLQLVTSNALPC